MTCVLCVVELYPNIGRGDGGCFTVRMTIRTDRRLTTFIPKHLVAR
jgi:hypothetical protein